MLREIVDDNHGIAIAVTGRQRQKAPRAGPYGSCRSGEAAVIIVRVYGGLGNQMFQYALGRRLALQHKTSLWIDQSWFAQAAAQGDTPRRYRLNRFRTQCYRLPDWLSGCLFRDFQRRDFERKKWWRPVSAVVEKKMGFDAHAADSDCTNSVYLDGYWQSERYFDAVGSMIRADFALATPLSAARQRLLGGLRGRTVASVHVRRTDYVSNPNNRALFGTCSPEWYAEAMRLMAEATESDCFLIFSDDIGWARANLPRRRDMIFVDFDDDREYEDMHLMASCRHHIIANSTFSWWGAWLNPSPAKKIFAPKCWFLTEPDVKDLVPVSWIRL